MSKHSIQNDPEIQQWIENERINYLIKSQAIKFGIFLSQHTRFEDFGSTSKESQEQIYQKFLETIEQQKVMSKKEQILREILNIYKIQAIDLSIMYKIDFGDDVIDEIKRLQDLLEEEEKKDIDE